MPDYRFRARSAIPGDYNFGAGHLAFLAAAADVWNGVERGDGTTGTKRASSITNCIPANIKNAIVIDDVTGTYSGGGVGDFPDPSNVTEDDTTDGVAGTFHIPDVGEVALGAQYGAAGTEFTGTYAVYSAPLISGTDVETKIYTVLSSDTAIKRRVSSRIYPLVMPQDPILPAITYQRVSSDPVNDVGGYSGLMNPHVVINAWAMSYQEAKALANEIHSAMDVAAMKNVLTNEIDGFEQDVNLFVVSQDFSCWNDE